MLFNIIYKKAGGSILKICFVTEGTVKDFARGAEFFSGADIVIFNAEGMGLVSYGKELTGETESFQEIAALSKKLNCVVIAGCDTETYGIMRRSAVICEKGKILGVSDMAHTIDESGYASGGGFRVYETEPAKIGLLVQEDLYFPEALRVLTLCDADIIINVFKEVKNHIPALMARSGAFANGVDVLTCASGYAFIADVKGELLFSSPQRISECEFSVEKDYHLVQARRKGCYREFDESY